MTTYQVIRFYRGEHHAEVIGTGLTLEEARAHCDDPESSSETATGAEATERTRAHGPWFDGYTAED